MQTSNTQNLWKPRTGTSPNPYSGGLRRHSVEQSLFLRRFRDLLEKRQQYSGRFASGDWRRRLIDKALYSTYLDCLSLDVGDEAREILHPVAEPAPE